MSVQVAMFLLTVSAVMTSLITQALKQFLKNSPSTVISAVVSIIVGIAVPVGYLIVNSLTCTTQDIVYIISLVVLTWLCATLGYDTVLEALKQIGIGGSKK